MHTDTFNRPTWLRWLPTLLALCLFSVLGSVILLATANLSGLMLYATVMGALSPFFLLLALVPVLNHEMRLVDSLRAGLLSK
jgi:hypothetical protein